MQKNELIKTKYSHLSLTAVSGLYQYVLFSDSASFWTAAEKLKGTTKEERFFLFYTEDDKSLIAPESILLEGSKIQKGWKAIRVIGEMPFGTVQGLLATISDTLKRNGLGVCVISTYLTDYFFVVEKEFGRAVEALKEDGWKFV